jgi:hypothetical protein
MMRQSHGVGANPWLLETQDSRVDFGIENTCGNVKGVMAV